jgi:hypothetical protein
MTNTDPPTIQPDPPPTIEDLLAATLLAWVHPDGQGTVRVADHVDNAQAARLLRHLADHVDPDVEVLNPQPTTVDGTCARCDQPAVVIVNGVRSCVDHLDETFALVRPTVEEEE